MKGSFVANCEDTTGWADLRRHALYRGLYSRVARRLGLHRSFVCRVAHGLRKSDQVQAALRREIGQIEQTLESARVAHSCPPVNGSSQWHGPTTKIPSSDLPTSFSCNRAPADRKSGILLRAAAAAGAPAPPAPEFAVKAFVAGQGGGVEIIPAGMHRSRRVN